MFYSQFILAKKGPLGTIWIAAHLERKLRKNQVTETNISISVDSIMFPEVPMALRLSGQLLLGVVRIYSRKVNYLFHDCSEALVKIKQAFHAGAVDLPPEAATAPFHSITLPETFDLDEFEPLPDREMNLLHSNGAADHHVTTREQITLQDPLEDNSYLESQFGLDERFPEGDVPRMGLDFDEDLLNKPSRVATPEPLTLQEENVPSTLLEDGIDYDQMDRMEAMDIDEQHEPATPMVGTDHINLEYQPEGECHEDDLVDRHPGGVEDMELDHQPQQLEFDNFEPDMTTVDRLEPATPATLEPASVEPQEQEPDGGKEVIASEEPVVPEVNIETSEHVETLDFTKQALLEEQVHDQQVQVEVKEGEVEQVTGNELEEKADEQVVDEVKEAEVQELEIAPEEVTGDANLKPTEEDKLDLLDVPELETVMSAVEVPIQEPDVFDIEQDMQREMASSAFQNEVLEERDPVLVEDQDVDVNLDPPVLSEVEPAFGLASPTMPSFDEVPGDDDVLASLLGRSGIALTVAPTPVQSAVVVKPRRKPGLRKRKLVMDMTTILPADVMREQLMHTDDIRRVRRKAPCTRQELWSVRKEALAQQLFSEPSVPDICSELRFVFHRVYVTGEADLPLAEEVPPAAEEVPEEPPLSGNEGAAEDFVSVPEHVSEEAPRQPVAEESLFEQAAEPAEQAVELALEPQQDMEYPGETTATEAVAGVEPEPMDVSMTDPPQEGETTVDGTAEGAEDIPCVTDQNEGSAEDGGHVVEAEDHDMSDTEYPAPEIVKEDEAPKDDEAPKSPSKSEGVEITGDVAVEEAVLAERQGSGESYPVVGEDVEVVAGDDFEVGDATITDAVEENAALESTPETVAQDEPGFENVADVTADVLEPEIEPNIVVAEAPEMSTFHEAESSEPPLTAHTNDDVNVRSSPVPAEEAGPPEEQGAGEELGFLADAGDTVFLAADDDDLGEEAEGFQDDEDYSHRDSGSQDNSGWSARTRAVGHYLRSALESKQAHMRRREERGVANLGLEQILLGKTRKESARMFFETLVLKTKDYIHVDQDAPYGDILISARPKLLKAGF